MKTNLFSYCLGSKIINTFILDNFIGYSYWDVRRIALQIENIQKWLLGFATCSICILLNNNCRIIYVGYKFILWKKKLKYNNFYCIFWAVTNEFRHLRRATCGRHPLVAWYRDCGWRDDQNYQAQYYHTMQTNADVHYVREQPAIRYDTSVWRGKSHDQTIICWER